MLTFEGVKGYVPYCSRLCLNICKCKTTGLSYVDLGTISSHICDDKKTDIFDMKSGESPDEFVAKKTSIWIPNMVFS